MITVEVKGDKAVEQLFLMAPKVYTDSIAHWFWRERKLFVGNKSRKGAFAKSLERKEHKTYGGLWRRGGIGQAFTGGINHPHIMNNMTLNMGVTDEWRKRMPYIDILSTGGTVRPVSKQWMLIPFYKNLRSIGLLGRIGNNARDKKNWTKWRREQRGHFDIFIYHGKLLVFGDYPSSEATGSHEARHMGRLNRKLLFVGVKRATIKKRFDFEKSFKRRVPTMIGRGEKIILTTTSKLDSGKLMVQ